MVKRMLLAAAFSAALATEAGPTRAQTVDTDMTAAATAWLDALGERRDDGSFPFDDSERMALRRLALSARSSASTAR